MERNDLTAKFVITIPEEYLLLNFEGNSFFGKKTCMVVAGKHKIDESPGRLKELLAFRKLASDPQLRPLNNRERRATHYQHHPPVKITASHPHRLHQFQPASLHPRDEPDRGQPDLDAAFLKRSRTVIV